MTPREWLDAFVAAVQTNDIASARPLFDPGVLGYGALTNRMSGRDDLVEQQWRPTWRRVAGWQVTSVDVQEQSDRLALLAFCWQRHNNDDRSIVNGRATLALRRDADDRWRCVHSHFSVDP